MSDQCDSAVIGGGFFGSVIARHLRGHFSRVVLLEEEADLLQRASYANQARVHNGYHYPRSLVTAVRSRINFPRFTHEYADCLDRTFHKYYAIVRQFSNVTAHYFELFCRRIGAPIAPAPPSVRRLFDAERIEAVFRVEEFAFDAVKLKERLRRELTAAGVEVALESAVRRVRPGPQGRLVLEGQTVRGPLRLEAERVFNCTYAQTNRLLCDSQQPPIALKHEFAELALVAVPEALRGLGITVMCGPFFSCMPFPPRGLHSLSHVRYTPHCAWQEGTGQPADAPARARCEPRRSNFPSMVRDAGRYLPVLRECRYHGSLWGIKTVLPASETNDGRPILFQKNVGLPNLHCVVGGKLDNVYDVLDEIDAFLLNPRSAA